MNILPGIQIRDLALEINGVLVFGDVHLGYEEALGKTGHFVPRFQFQDTIKRLTKILGNRVYKQIILNGDIKHEFGSISSQEWRDSLKVFDLLAKHTNHVTLIRGNHDTILGPIGKKRGVEIVDEASLGRIYVCHGHVVPTTAAYKKAAVVIIGHEHPAVSLQSGIRSETFKCYLKGTINKKKLIVMPSFNLVTTGTNILQETLLSPFLTMQKNLDNFSVYVVEDEVDRFGTVKKIGIKMK